jgi:hypothetical protein
MASDGYVLMSSKSYGYPLAVVVVNDYSDGRAVLNAGLFELAFEAAMDARAVASVLGDVQKKVDCHDLVRNQGWIFVQHGNLPSARDVAPFPVFIEPGAADLLCAHAGTEGVDSLLMTLLSNARRAGFPFQATSARAALGEDGLDVLDIETALSKAHLSPVIVVRKSRLLRGLSREASALS